MMNSPRAGSMQTAHRKANPLQSLQIFVSASVDFEAMAPILVYGTLALLLHERELERDDDVKQSKA